MNKLEAIAAPKTFRKELDDILQRMKKHRLEMMASGSGSAGANPELEATDLGEAIAQHTISTRDLESVIMRQGMVLKNIGDGNPYPESKDPTSPTVRPPDGVTL